MISNNKFLVAAGAAALSAGIYTSAVSAATVTATATANVVQGLTITEDNGGINFGDVSEAGAGTVVIDTAGARTTTGGADILAGGGEQAGLYTITGEDGKAYTISFPGSATIQEIGGDTMSVDTWTHNADGTAAAAGEQFDLGATLNIGAGQTPGSYSGTYTITVNYN